MHAAIFALLITGGQAAATGVPQNVTKSTVLKPGTYRLTAPITVSGTNVVLDGGGATLQGNGSGVGISIGKGTNITIKNLKVRGFRWGIQAEGTANLQMVTVDSSSNANHFESMDGKAVADAEGSKEPDYGGGILLRKVSGGTLTGVQAHGQWNGITLSGCTKITLDKCDLSKNDDTGLHLWGSSDNEIRDSKITWVGIGVVKDGKFARKGGDQAGILLEHESNRNHFLRNNLVHSGGNGVFLRANELAAVPAAEARKQKAESVGEEPVLLPTHPSNDNLFQENDASFAEDGSSFEAGYCSGNQFVGNVAAFSNCGFSLGFSREAVVKGNLIVANRSSGVRLNNGWHNTFEANTFVRDYGSPVALSFSDEDANAAKPNHGAQNRSGSISIFDNTFVGYGRPFRFVQTSPATIQSNSFVNLESSGQEADLADSTGPKPVFVNNNFTKHTGPDMAPSNGEIAPLPSTFDKLGGVSVTRLAPKAQEGVVLGSLTGRFDGEEFELGRVPGPAGRLTFPPRLVQFVRVQGADRSPASFIALIGDQSLALRQSTDASVDGDNADLGIDGDWDVPGRTWQPTDATGQYFQVDLRRQAMIDAFAISANVMDPKDFWSKFHIAVSETGQFDGEEQIIVTETDWENHPGPIRTYQVKPIRGRFVRIVGDVGQKGVQLQEFAVYGRTN